MERCVYFVVSQTGTCFSRLLQLFNRAEYNHVSLSLDDSLDRLYSFGRQCLYFPLAAGFVREQPHYGIYCQYSDTRCAVYRVPVRAREFWNLHQSIRQFEQQEWRFRYNFAGLLAIQAGIPLHRRRHFVCSQFVAYVLEQSGLHLFDKDYSLVRPQDFMRIPHAELVYQGPLNAYQHPGHAPAPLYSSSWDRMYVM